MPGDHGAAAAATLIDLAARRHLELFEIGPGHTGVRVRAEPVDPLTDYEEQVLDLVRRHAVGGSAPLEAIQLDEAGAASWRVRFADAVQSDAKEQGLLRNRWTRADFLVLGGLAAALGFLAGALFVAHVEQKPDRNGDHFDRETWFLIAAAVWFGIMVVLRRLRSIRYSTAGEAAAARWLGVKRYLQHDESFGDLPPAGVAWSRVGGQWHQVHVEYPERFGYGQPPSTVLLNGVMRTAVWVPHLRGADLEFFERLGMQAGHVFQRLEDAVVGRQ